MQIHHFALLKKRSLPTSHAGSERTQSTVNRKASIDRLVLVNEMTKLTFYGGVNEIGGNKILVEDKKTKLVFDFGQSFTFGADYFTGWLAPRAINGLGDYFAFDLLPRISGLYSKEQLASTDLSYTEPQINAVFLSHAHFDHITHIQFLDPEIPIHLGVGTKLLMESMEETSSFCKYGEHKCHKFRTGHEKKIDNIKVEPVHVDHSIPAAKFLHMSSRNSDHGLKLMDDLEVCLSKIIQKPDLIEMEKFEVASYLKS